MNDRVPPTGGWRRRRISGLGVALALALSLWWPFRRRRSVTMPASVRWFRTDADTLGVDPDRIDVMGHSAGAIMSMYTTFDSEDAGSSGNPGVSSEVAGGTSLAGFAVAGLIDPGEPPIPMFHGTADGTVPFGAANATCDATLAAGNSCELIAYDGAGHSLEQFHDEIVDRTLGFIGVG